ncbi:MAG TPA: heptaprenyl diphosphate synthase [Thermotogae bacterium]|nr:heptaprenyl diphosphate synthase [Thermotogota bacterium]
MVPFPLPVGRWGLSNYPVLTVLLNGGISNALIVLTVKSFIGSMITGSFLSPQFVMGLSGGLCAVLTMGSFRKVSGRFSIVGISVAGATANNIVQVLTASLFVKSMAPAAYLPLLLIIGEISAIANAYLSWKTLSVIGGKIV